MTLWTKENFRFANIKLLNKLTYKPISFAEASSIKYINEFSSMPLKDSKLFKEKLVHALKETNNRSVVLTGTSGMTFEEQENVFAIDQAPIG